MFVFPEVNILKIVVSLLLCTILAQGCVSHTERLPYRPHMEQQDKDVWEEVKQEFGWNPSNKSQKAQRKQESLYSKMTRSVKGWFREDEPQVGPDVHPHHWKRINEEYYREQNKLGVY